MNASKKNLLTGFCLALAVTIPYPNFVAAQESFRLSRPAQPGMVGQASTPQPPTQSKANAPLKAKASVDTETGEEPTAQYHNPIFDWEKRNLLIRYEESEPEAAPPQSASAPQHHHHGLKAHIGMAVIGLGAVAGTAAGAYVGVNPVHHAHAMAAAMPPAHVEPTIGVTAGHCPAAFDPEFQVPVRWWDTLSKEEASPELGPQWKLWMEAVTSVFQSRAYMLSATGGVSSLHIMVNPDGSIFNITPYTGAERGNPGRPLSQRAMENLQHIVAEVGNFPPFPEGSKVRCYHLIFSGSAGIN